MKLNKRILEQAVDLILRYQEEAQDQQTPVVRYLPAERLREKLDLSLGGEGIHESDLIPLLEQYLHHSVRTDHPQFLNQLYGGFNGIGWLGDAVAALASSSMATFEISPVATLMELELIDRMNGLIGYENGDGLFCTGGSNANMLAMLCARNAAFPWIRDSGFASGERPTAFISDQAHYSFVKAAGQLGIGIDNVVKVATDGEGGMLPAELDREVARCRAGGGDPFFVGATSGTTVLGAFDPLEDIAAVCRRHGLWFHVDGAWGGPALFSRRHRNLLAGCRLADSFTWDAHKLMGTTLICSAILTREKGVLHQACALNSAADTEYLFHQDEDSGFNLGEQSLQCGRRIDALKFWLMWKHLGDDGWEAWVDRLFELAAYAAEKVEQSPNLEMLAPPQGLNICFRRRPPAGIDADSYNLQIRELLRKSGRSMVNYSKARGRLAIRLVISNQNTSEADLDRFFDYIEEVASEIDA